MPVMRMDRGRNKYCGRIAVRECSDEDVIGTRSYNACDHFDFCHRDGDSINRPKATFNSRKLRCTNIEATSPPLVSREIFHTADLEDFVAKA